MITRLYADRALPIILSFLLLFSCDGRKEHLEYYEDGNIRSRVYLVDGKREGIVTTYSSTGKIISKHTYKEDSLTGPYEVFFPDGGLAEKGQMKNGRRVGRIFQYHPNGKIHFEHYMISVDGRPFPYYSQEFNSAGVLVSSNKRVNLDIEKITEDLFEVKVTNLEEFEYDSIKVVLGNFDDDFRPAGNVDSLVITEKVVTLRLRKSDNQHHLRGYLIRYKTNMRRDTVVNFASYTYFEQPFVNTSE